MNNIIPLIVQNIPALILALQKLQERLQDNANREAVEGDMAKIIKAFEEKDEKALRDVFATK